MNLITRLNTGNYNFFSNFLSVSLEKLLKFANHNYILNLSAPLNGIRKDDFERLHYASIFEFFIQR